MSFVFYYPLVMSVVWMLAGILFYARRERRPTNKTLEYYPMVTILIPSYNEEDTIADTLYELQGLDYPNYEIVVINDGSKDRSLHHMSVLVELYDHVRIITLKKNRGKANALKIGVLASRGEILVTLDADSVLEHDALHYLVVHFIRPGGERVGAVTGNPRVRNRSSLLAKIQLVEYSSIIGLIKRSQRVLGKIMTVSGVIVAFRKRALIDCGLWDVDLITDDIGVSWKLQRRFWDIRYEPNALCWMLVPETLGGLWKQRVRWAQGGIEVLLRHWKILFDWRHRRLIPILIEQLVSIVWSICWLVTTLFLVGQMVITRNYYVPIFWTGTYLAVVSLVQVFIALLLDHQYERGLLKYFLWSIWYPSIYWYVNALVVIRAIPKAIIHMRAVKKGQKYAVWDSPDRGISS